jgi:Ca2+/Na+ antiporter
LSPYLQAVINLIIGLIILVAACEILVSATERLAARFQWNHYIAGTLAEILSTTPELVVIAFIVPISPVTAFIISVVTIYNNALVFSLYSYFLPKDKEGKFLMPTPITEVGTQILIGGGAMGLILGLVMLTLNSAPEAKNSFSVADLIFISIILLTIFAVYLYKLVTNYAKEEAEVRENLSMSEQDIEQRLELVYANVKPSTFWLIAVLFIAGISGAFIGGHVISHFASTMIQDLEIDPILTALILALFAGMSEYVILWQSHRKREYGIALANAFGGITQVMFLVLPFTLLCIALYQGFLNPAHPELPLEFSISNIFLLLFLFPTFYTLSSLLEEDHTLGILDTTIMTGIFLFLIVLLVSYGGTSA